MRRQTKHLQETDVALFKSRGRVSMLEIRLRFKIRLRGIKWEGKCKCCPDPTYSASDEDEVGEAVFEIPVLFQNHQQCQSSFCSQVSSKHCIAVWNITLSGMCAIKWEWSFKGKLLSSVVRALARKMPMNVSYLIHNSYYSTLYDQYYHPVPQLMWELRASIPSVTYINSYFLDEE